jgi:hypothetical protein
LTAKQIGAIFLGDPKTIEGGCDLKAVMKIKEWIE